MEILHLEQNTRLCLAPLLYQYKTTSLPMLVVALSWEVDWASIGSRRLLRTEDRLLFQVKEGRESRSKRTEGPDMEFVQKFTPPDFQAKNFTPSISPNFNSFSGKKHKK